MSNENHETWAGYAASFALGALEPGERAAYETHLAGCSECRAEIDSYRDVAAGLAGTLAQRNPPPALRSRILDEARKVRPLASRAASEKRPETVPPMGRAPSPDARGGQPSTRNWLLAASIGVAMIAAAAWFSERNGLRQAEQTMSAMTADAQSNATRIAELESGIAQRDSILSAVLAPDIATTRLTSQGLPPSARVYWSRQQNRVVFAAFDLPPAPIGRTYQLWGIPAGGTPVSLGTFNTDSGGAATVTLPVSGALQIDIAAVTDEPAGGSPQPTTQPFLVGEIATR